MGKLVNPLIIVPHQGENLLLIGSKDIIKGILGSFRQICYSKKGKQCWGTTSAMAHVPWGCVIGHPSRWRTVIGRRTEDSLVKKEQKRGKKSSFDWRDWKCAINHHKFTSYRSPTLFARYLGIWVFKILLHDCNKFSYIKKKKYLKIS